MATSIAKESKLLAKHSLIYSLGTFCHRAMSLLLLPVYTRFLTPQDYGIKELVGLSTDVIGILMSKAISSGIYRFYFEYSDSKDRNEVISSAFITLGSFGIFILFLLSFITKTLAKYILDSSNLYYFFLIAFASLWLRSLNQIGYNYLQANQQSLKYTALSLGKLLISLSLNIYFICIMKIGVLGILISGLITASLMWIVLVVPLCYKIGLSFSFEKIKEMLKYGLPLVPSQLGAFFVHLSDRFFIKGYCSIADAGLYSLGYRFGALPTRFISGPFNQTYQPRRFEIYKEKNSNKIFGKLFTYYLYLIGFAGLLIAVLTKDLLVIIADERFWSAYKIVPIIVIATSIFSFSSHLNLGILIEKKTKYLAYINLSNGIIILFLNFIFIPRYGAYGAAIITLVAFVYKVSLTYYFSSRYYKICFEYIRIVKIIFAIVLVYLMTLPIRFSSIYVSFIVKAVIVLLYPILLFSLNFYLLEEKQKIKYLLKPRILFLKRKFIS